MDQTLSYRDVLTSVLRQEARLQPKHGPVQSVAVCDHESNQYLLVAVGWEGKQRVNAILFHAQLNEAGIVIETDNTEEGLKPLLCAAGVPATNIIFATQQPTLKLERAAA